MPDLVIVGAGAIGAAVAWRAAQAGLDVTLVDPNPHRAGAWHTAAGMLAPVTELHYTETPLLRLTLDSLARYPDFVAELVDETGTEVGFRECGTVAAAWDAADLSALRDQHAFLTGHGLDAALITGRELRALEPALAPGLPGGLLVTSDHQVDPRLLHAALLAACATRGVRLVEAPATVTEHAGRVTGVRAGSQELTAGQVVVAAGAWSGRVPGVPALPVRPVKGQTLRLRLPGAPRLRHVVRAVVKGTPSYLVPRDDGQIVVGATVEEVGFDERPRAGAVYELLRDAQSLLPELGEAELEEVCTGLRPGSPDNAPLVGRPGPDGLIVAAGHHRNGILLSPVTADGVVELITTGALPAVLAGFGPDRFATAVSA